jgi:Beta-lactamase enzyme family
MLALDRRLTAVVLCLAAFAVSCGSADTYEKGDAVEALEQMGTLRYLIATPSNGECNVLADLDGESLVPLASVFKLYVLGALVHAVGSGEITWDDLVEIRDELDSLGGPTADEEPGTELSVQELATRMISVSDNTATDHLMDFVGREAVEEIQSAMGHSQPSVNIPMLTGRELTVLKWSGDADLAERYIAADADERRSILDDEVSRRLFPTDTDVSVFQYQNLMGWFGTPGDACRALGWLTPDDQARAVLTHHPLSPNPELWPELGFKGGSDNGVATAAWWMRADDGQMYVTVVSLVNNTAELDLDRVVELMAALRDETPALRAD